MTLQPHSRLWLLLGALLVLSLELSAQDAPAFFEQNCTSCHSIGGGRLLGPDLKGVTERRSEDWLKRFIQDPQGVINSGDPAAAKMLQEAGGIVMPKVPGVTAAMAEALVKFLHEKSEAGESKSAAAKLPVAPPNAKAAANYFGQNCQSCHTIGGGRLGGPDLKGVTARRDREWLVRFIQDPQAVLKRNDPYSKQLLAEANGSVMPTPPGITPEMAAALVDFVEFQSMESATPEAAPLQAQFTQEDVMRGRRLFVGQERFANGAPSCMSCHTVTGVGALAGGRLGPDLTKVHRRLNGTRGLMAWLGNPPSATMQPIFVKKPLAKDEIAALTAYFEDSAGIVEQPAGSSRMKFVLMGLGGAGLGLLAMNAGWRKRLRGVRRPLVHNSNTRNGGRA